MTHEQKPQSAEFRTWDVNAWQPISTAPKDGTCLDLWVEGEESATRYENAHYGIEQHECGEYGRYCDSCPAPGKRWIDAFGMAIVGNVTHWRAIPASPEAEAEQRRKDAEGTKQVGYLHSAIMKNGETWESTLTDIEDDVIYPEDVYWAYSIKIEPVYTQSANVAALEDRVKELEGEICSIRKRVKDAASSVMGITTEAMGGDNLAITLASYFEDLLGERDPNGWHPEAQKACDEIEAAIVAHMRAAIREGGE